MYKRYFVPALALACHSLHASASPSRAPPPRLVAAAAVEVTNVVLVFPIPRPILVLTSKILHNRRHSVERSPRFVTKKTTAQQKLPRPVSTVHPA
ncbi:hypothetical protein SESBI_07566 [Sesbania bispinosa]|nr:hypothetical protein SESBI_07566 [Sesbania bispinosa]